MGNVFYSLDLSQGIYLSVIPMKTFLYLFYFVFMTTGGSCIQVVLLYMTLFNEYKTFFHMHKFHKRFCVLGVTGWAGGGEESQHNFLRISSDRWQLITVA